LSNETMPLLEVIEKAGGIHAPSIKLNYWKLYYQTQKLSY